ncbi:uncharacterized protein LOC106753781 isoform X1 [Vigna radiata var. radiata]|uniref:Uncharacterized protein LOC106753781 isoform X1 n=4 Tax=Vigna TaxID=3913 RepID=A0A1S3TBI1_VIGRR|nr:uncharacterized protein LOC106753781 isoform X1 [Vigna radiata var. radiata]
MYDFPSVVVGFWYFCCECVSCAEACSIFGCFVILPVAVSTKFGSSHGVLSLKTYHRLTVVTCKIKQFKSMDPEAARAARESLDLAFHMSNILDTGLDRHTLSVLIALCDLGVNPEALAAVVKELRKEKPSLSSSLPEAPSSFP